MQLSSHLFPHHSSICMSIHPSVSPNSLDFCGDVGPVTSMRFLSGKEPIPTPHPGSRLAGGGICLPLFLTVVSLASCCRHSVGPSVLREWYGQPRTAQTSVARAGRQSFYLSRPPIVCSLPFLSLLLSAFLSNGHLASSCSLLLFPSSSILSLDGALCRSLTATSQCSMSDVKRRGLILGVLVTLFPCLRILYCCCHNGLREIVLMTAGKADQTYLFCELCSASVCVQIQN